MASELLHLRSSTPGAVPTTAQLAAGQIAINTADEKLYILNASGSVVQVGTGTVTSVNGVAPVSGNVTLTPANLGATTIGTSLFTAASAAAALSAIGAIATSQINVANGVAPLDASGLIPLTNIPPSLIGAVDYQGSFNPASNTVPAAASTNKGWYYVVSAAGSYTPPGQTALSLNSGDWLISDGVAWSQIETMNAVASVNGKTGAVVLSATDITTGTFAAPQLGAGPAASSVLTTNGSSAPTWVTVLPAANLPTATATSLGIVQAGSGLTITSGVVAADVLSVAGRTGAVTLSAADVGLGNVKNVDQTNASNLTSGTVAVGLLTTFIASGASHQAGIVPDPGLTAGTTRYLREDATWDVPPGTVYTLPAATTTTLGGVIVGSGLSVASGTIAADVLSVAGRTGTITLSASDVGLANVKNVDQTNASNLTSGAVAVSLLPIMGASGTSHSAGIVPDPGATAGTTRYLREDGTWDVPPGGSSYTLPAATATTLGGVIIPAGSGLTINASGDLSADVLSVAGRTGAVTLSYTDISGLSTVAHSGSFADLLNIPTASATQLGLVQVGANLTITSGVLAGQPGTVTSVGLSLPSIFTVTGSPVTSSGTLTATLATALPNTIFSGPSSGAAAIPTFRALTLTDLPTGYLWSALGAPTANVALTMGAYTTTFNSTLTTAGFTWQQSTAATSGANQNSMGLALGGTVWNGTASINDVWQIQVVEGTGANPTSTLVINHTGSSGAAAVNVSGANIKLTGTGVGVTFADGTTQTTAASGGSSGGIVPYIPAVNAATAYTLALTDAPSANNYEGILQFSAATAITVTVPTNATVAFTIGTSITLVPNAAGQITVSPAAGVTVNTASTLSSRTTYSAIQITKLATDTWLLTGDIA